MNNRRTLSIDVSSRLCLQVCTKPKTKTDERADHKARRGGVEKETLVHILCGCPTWKKLKMQTLGFARIDLEQIKEARVSGIVALDKGTRLLNSPL